MRLEDLMERAAQYDENLARDIKDYVHGRKYGLVYEASKPLLSISYDYFLLGTL